MTKVVVTSDLHLGITSPEAIRALVSSIAAEQPDVTILAGDIAEGLPLFEACLRMFAILPGKVAVLAGNHDIWSRMGVSSQQFWEHALPEVVKAAGMLWLEEMSWQEGGFAVAGSLAWYDYSAVDPTLPAYPPRYFAKQKRFYNADALYVDWPWSDLVFARRLGHALIERLDRLEADPNVEHVLVVTHVPLFNEQMCRKPESPDWGFSNAYFGNLTLGQQVLQMGKVGAVISGHTHIEREGQVRRPGSPEGRPVTVSVLGCDYNAPVYKVISLPSR